MLTNNIMKKVLMIAYYFPPCGESGVYRTLRFIKYLPQYQWQSIILTILEDQYESYNTLDPTLINQIPKEVEIYRTSTFNLLKTLIELRNRIKGIFLVHKDKEASLSSECRFISQETKPTIIKRIKDNISSFLSFPDKQIGWFPFAVLTGRRLIKKKQINLIYSVGTPWTSHLIGYFLKKVTKKPWVVDFRDPWTQNPWREKYSPFREKLEEIAEYKILKLADRIITNTEALRRDFIGRYNKLPEDKFMTITNGFEPSEFEKIARGKNKWKNKFIITHTGSLYGKRSPINLLKAISELIREGKIKEYEIQINFVGTIDERYQIEKIIANLNIKKVVNLVGYVSHKECIDYIINSDILLLIQPATKLQIPAKVFEYIGAQIPIFALATEGATAELILKENLGLVTDPNNMNTIKEKLYSFFNNFKKGNLNYNRNVSHKYEASVLTGKLAQVFDNLIN